MVYAPLTDPRKIKTCFESFRDQFAARGVVVPGVRPYGYPVPQVRWHGDLGIWSAFGENWRGGAKGDWFALFGVGEPTPNRAADIVLEINVYKRDPTRQIDGRYLADGEGALYVGRTSTANKGRGVTVPIISAAPQWASDVEVIDWGRKKNDTENVILIGAVDDPKLPERVAALVATVHAIKSGVRPGSIPVPERTKPTVATKSPT